MIPPPSGARVRAAWISLTDIAGDSWFRSVAANPPAVPEHVVTAVLNALDPSQLPRSDRKTILRRDRR